MLFEEYRYSAVPEPSPEAHSRAGKSYFAWLASIACIALRLNSSGESMLGIRRGHAVDLFPNVSGIRISLNAQRLAQEMRPEPEARAFGETPVTPPATASLENYTTVR